MGTGVASFVLFLLLLILWESARASEVCRRRIDCGIYDAPSSKDRVCKIYNTTSGSIVLEWYTGTLNSSRCTASAAKLISRDFSKFCPGYVGMSMSLWCDFVNVTSVIYKNGVPLTSESTVTFNRLQKEDEGLYQCKRHGSLELIAEFNMTVQSKIHIIMHTRTHLHTYAHTYIHTHTHSLTQTNHATLNHIMIIINLQSLR